jgi:FkbM family methyltransferase
MKIKKIAKGLINRMVQPWGLELAYSHVLNRPEVSRDWLRGLHIRTVLDIGANIGQFAMEIRDILPEAFIYSFEPLRDAHASLVSEMRGDSKFKAFNFALGNQDSRAVIHRSSSTDSSSLLPMLDRHKEAWPYTAGSTTEDIEIRRLDSLNLTGEAELLVKIDVQGFEDRVIAGGQDTISRAAYIITEVSFQMLYDGQPLFDDIYQILKGMGFDYGGSWGQLPDPRDGRPLQADAIFIKQDHLP